MCTRSAIRTNNAIGAASGDMQGLLTYSNLTHSTGNAFADFLVESDANAHGNPAGIHSELYPGFRDSTATTSVTRSRSRIFRMTGR